jgi:hypothetical protein
MTMNQLFKLKSIQAPLLMITQLVSDSTTNSYSDYHQELKLNFQEITGSELLDLVKTEIMVMMQTQEIDAYLSSNTHGIPMVCKYNSLLMILKLPTIIFTIQLKSQMTSINNGTMFISHILMQISPLPEVSNQHPQKTGSFHNSQEPNIMEKNQ